MIVVRLQTIVSREVAPGDTAVLTVGSIQAGTNSNVIPDRAVLQLNIRTHTEATRTVVLEAIHRVVRAECQASGCPKEPEFELFDRFPVTDNDRAATERVDSAFTEFFEDRAKPVGQQSASEDFSDIPTALGVPYTDWFIGGVDADRYENVAQAGLVAQDIPVNHSATFAPVIQPTLDTGTQALVVAALAWLAARSPRGPRRIDPRRESIVVPRSGVRGRRGKGRVEVVTDADHADDEAQHGGADRGERPAGPEHAGHDRDGSADQRRNGVEPAAEHRGNTSDQHVPECAAADRGDPPDDDRLRWAEAQVDRFSGAGDGE